MEIRLTPAAYLAATHKNVTRANTRYLPVTLMEPAAKIIRQWAEDYCMTDEQADNFGDSVWGVEPHEVDELSLVYAAGIAQGAIERGEPLDADLLPVRDAMRQFAVDCFSAGHRSERYVQENFPSVVGYALTGNEKWVEV